VRDAAARWAPHGVTIRFGVEITYDRAHEADIREHLARHAYDFVIGSVHVYADSPFHATRVAAWTADRPLAEIVAPYFDEVAAAIRSGLFTTIGHLDFVKRYLVPHVIPSQLAAAPELYEPLLVALVETGTALEVNTSGLRQAAGETYPAGRSSNAIGCSEAPPFRRGPMRTGAVRSQPGWRRGMVSSPPRGSASLPFAVAGPGRP
jgi:histidinol-phosphatase (PHP family)